MIDPHVHLRDWAQARKETLAHGFSVAWRAGLDGVFEMPNTDPPLTSLETILRRIDEADKALSALGVPLFHGLYAGLTPDPFQIEEAVRAWKELFPRVVGLKMFAGNSTGGMGIPEKERQAAVYGRLASLGFTGVLAVHCEKEILLRAADWDPQTPASHARARPPSAEVASVDDQIALAREAGFKGTLHVVHVSTPWALDLLRNAHSPAGSAPGFTVTCGLTPHHALLDAGMMSRPGGLLLKTNPPLRPKPMPRWMLVRLMNGDVDWIETDHAPHTLEDKLRGFASGIPCLPFYPRFIGHLRELGITEQRLKSVTHDSICGAFGIEVENRGRKADADLSKEYEFDPFAQWADS
jgi:dihydroorotase